MKDNIIIIESRSHYFDFLRVAGAFAVMLIHVAAHNWYTLDVHSSEWQVINFWHGIIGRWATPCFTMISGALFLSRDIPLGKIYGKYVRRILTALVFWSFVYAFADYAKNGNTIKALVHFFRGIHTFGFSHRLLRFICLSHS